MESRWSRRPATFLKGEACLALGPPAGQHVRLVARLAGPRRAEGQVLHPFRSRLELARDPRWHAKGVPRTYLDDLVVQLRPAVAGDHHVELLLLLLPVPERQPEVRRELLEADAGVLHLEVAAGEMCFQV